MVISLSFDANASGAVIHVESKPCLSFLSCSYSIREFNEATNVLVLTIFAYVGNPSFMARIPGNTCAASNVVLSYRRVLLVSLIINKAQILYSVISSVVVNVINLHVCWYIAMNKTPR